MADIKINISPDVSAMLNQMSKENPKMTLAEAMQNIEEYLADEETISEAED